MIISLKKKNFVPGWDRTANLSVNRRMRYRLRHGDSIFNSSKKSCKISIYYPFFSEIISLNVKISKIFPFTYNESYQI